MTAAPEPTPSIAEIEEIGRLRMPPSARDIEAYSDTDGIDDIIIVQFKLPQDELKTFLADAGYAEPLQAAEGLTSIPGWAMGFDELLPTWPREEEWQRMLEDPEHILMVAESSEPGFYRSVVVDLGDPDLYTIYLRHNDL